MGLRLLLILALFAAGCSQPAEPLLVSEEQIAIIPQPRSVDFTGKKFELNEESRKKLVVQVPLATCVTID